MLRIFRSDGAVIFNTTTDGGFNGLVFENQYLELSTQLPPNPQIYGLGEHVCDTAFNTVNVLMAAYCRKYWFS